jgi:hypothetical protein
MLPIGGQADHCKHVVVFEDAAQRLNVDHSALIQNQLYLTTVTK